MSSIAVLQALSFAAYKHRDQRRKNAEKTPYINHPIAVAWMLAEEGGVTDETMLVAAVLHDTVEDTDTSYDELRDQFGMGVAQLVSELTDDKSLPKQERKRLQIEHAAELSDAAKQLKIADKTCNLRDLAAHPPEKWGKKRLRKYVEWAVDVVASCRGVNPRLDAAFDATVAAVTEAARPH